ncbi:hypothetical protein BC830DRAFT_560443 [Chytriomyces sp. MP71]|nr:hypothetical protein BC830DRAFT_560443 [Chytriomyces sp. MP71]
MKQSIANDLFQPKQLLPTSSSTATNLSKLSMNSNASTVPPTAVLAPPTPKKKFKLKVRKEGPAIVGSELRVAHSSCVKLSNIEHITARFNDLIQAIPVKFRSNVLKGSSSAESLHKPLPKPPVDGRRKLAAVASIRTPSAQLTPRITGHLTVLGAQDLSIVRPYATQVSFRILTMPLAAKMRTSSNGGTGMQAEHLANGGREIGQTRRRHQGRHVSYVSEHGEVEEGSVIPLLLTDAEIRHGLQVALVHHVPAASGSKTSSGRAYNDFIVALEGFSVASVVEAAIAKGPKEGCVFGVNVGGGMVKLKLVVQEGVVATVVRNRIEYVVHQTIEDSKGVLVDKDVSAEHKKSVIMVNNITNLFSSKYAKQKNAHLPLSSADVPSELDVHVKISPLLDFINGNLSVIAETMSLPLANLVVQGLWERFIVIAESLIVPNLSDDNGLLDRKKVWEDSRVVFLSHVVAIVKQFLHADEEGLSMEQMEAVESLTELDLLFKYYGAGKRELLQLHADYVFKPQQQKGLWSDQWLLKLIKLRGGNADYVNNAMRKKVA